MKRVSKPRIGILNKEFKYHSSADTDVARTFARIRRQMRDQTKPPVVVAIKQRAKA